MKLRLYRDSIRLRVSPDDVATLMADREVRETTRFAPGVEFAYAIRLSDDAESPRATFAPSGVVVELSAARAHAWADGGTVGIRHEQPAGAGRALVILIEKDFECLDEPADASTDRFYPNPKKAC